MAQLPPPPAPSGSPGAVHPGSVVPPAAPPRPPRPARRWVPIAVVAVLLVAGGTLVATSVRGNTVAVTGRPGAGVIANLPTPPAEPTATVSPVPSGRPAPAPGPVAPPLAPAGYQVFHEAAGYWIAVPKSGWTTETDSVSGDREWWGDLSRTEVKLLFVNVHVAVANKQTARAALAAYEYKQRHGSNIFYHRIRLLTPHPVPGATSTADLEFTDRDNYQTYHYHTYVRFITSRDGHLFTVELSILHEIYNDSGDTDTDWQRAVPTTKQVLASIRLG